MLSDYGKFVPVNVKSASGELYYAERISDGLDVTIKFNVDTARASTERFQRENEIIHDLAPHDHVIEPISRILREIHNGIEKDYYVMGKADTNLESWMYLPQSSDIDNLLDIFRQICLGLKHAHTKGYTHRDLHPGNVLMNLSPKEQIKLIDFGRAYDFNFEIDLSEGNPIWGLLVMPPEVRFGTLENPDSMQYERGDVFALGIIWMMLFTKSSTPVIDMMQASYQMYQFMNPTIRPAQFEQYYQSTTIEERQAKFSEWLNIHSTSTLNKFSIQLLDVDLGDKLTNLARKMLAFDPNTRLTSVDDVINELSGL